MSDWTNKRNWLIEQAYGRLPDSDDPDRRAAWREGINAVLAVIEASHVEVGREELLEFLYVEGGSPENESEALLEAFVIYRRKGGAA